MFKFWYEKLAITLIPLLVFISFFVIVIYAFYTVIMVPPAENAPFVQEIREVAAKKKATNTVSLSKPHRADTEMKLLLTKMASEALSFNKETFSEVVKTIRPYFTDRGFQQYQKYLIESGIAENLRANDYNMSVYIENPPLSLNGTVVDGVYKWLYQMPVVISFFPREMETLAENSNSFVNRKINLRLQVTRVNLDDDPDAIQIEDWIVTSR